jgi:long-chain fatty acid transport protein
MRKYRQIIFIVFLLECFLHSSALALTNEEVFSQFQFNFITPGARATALGGAFIGLADDATAAEANPAGLTILTEPEISTEFKYLGYTAEHVYENLSPETDITRKGFDDSVVSVPFMSVVYPYKRFVLSAYRQELVNYKSSYRTANTEIYIPDSGSRFSPVDASVELTVVNYGLGIAIKIFEELSLAVSPRLSQMKMKSHSTRYGFYTDFSEDDIGDETNINDDDSGFSINAGILWRPHSKVSIGAVYRRGTKFTVTEKPGRRVGRPNLLDPNDDEYDPDLAEFTLKVPDSFGVGVAFRATDSLTLTLDVVHIQYKDLLEDFDVAPFGEFVRYYTSDYYTVDNVTEIHFGMEYILTLGERLLALRAGVYNDPDHTIRYTGTSEWEEWEYIHRPERALFPGGNDQIHVTGGLGLVLNEQFQIDAAANIADRNSQFSISAVYRFGGTKKVQATKPLLNLSSSAKPVKEVPPSIRFKVVMTEGIGGKSLEIQKITTDTHGIGNVKVTTKQVGTTEFLVTAALEREEKRFTADIRIDIGQQEMTIKDIESLGQVMIMKEQPDALEFMIKFM